MAANMLTAYYSRECDSHEIFDKLKIAEADSYEKKMNQYDTIFVNMQEFLSQSSSMDEMLDFLRKSILWDLLETYPDFSYFNRDNLARTISIRKHTFPLSLLSMNGTVSSVNIRKTMKRRQNIWIF